MACDIPLPIRATLKKIEREKDKDECEVHARSMRGWVGCKNLWKRLGGRRGSEGCGG